MKGNKYVYIAIHVTHIIDTRILIYNKIIRLCNINNYNIVLLNLKTLAKY